MSTPKLFLSLSAALAVALPAAARVEKPDLTSEQLLKTASHVVVGKVAQTWSRDESSAGWERTHYVAEIAVEAVEKGDDLKPGQLVYARYWRKRWSGPGTPPPDTNGHRGLPKPDERVRVHLARDGYDGFGTTNDHGFNVIGANGFARP